MGRMTGDPVPVRRPGGKSYVGFGFVVNDRERTAGGEWRDVPTFIDCEAAGELGERVARDFRKGFLVMLEGRLRLDEWTDSNKVRHRKHVFVLHDIKLILRPKAAQLAADENAAKSSEPVSEPDIV